MGRGHDGRPCRDVLEVEEAVTADLRKEPAQDGAAANASGGPAGRPWRLPENCVEVQRPGRTLTIIGRPRPEAGRAKPATVSAQLTRGK